MNDRRKKYARLSLACVLQTDYDSEIFYLNDFANLSDRKKADVINHQAQKYFCDTFDREKRYLVILSRDLSKGYNAINSLGIEKAKSLQLYYDYICDFEKLQALMKEFRWSCEFLKENGIDFKSYRKLYFSVA